MAELHKVVLFMYTEELNYDLCRKMDGTDSYHVHKTQPDPEKKTQVFFHMWEEEVKGRGGSGKSVRTQHTCTRNSCDKARY